MPNTMASQQPHTGRSFVSEPFSQTSLLWLEVHPRDGALAWGRLCAMLCREHHLPELSELVGFVPKAVL